MSHNGLVLPGGGARGAYQVGVLKAIAEIVPGRECPFDVMTGTSVGAINALSLAGHAHNFKRGMRRIERLWAALHAGRVYNISLSASMILALYWLYLLIPSRFRRNNVIALLDSEPLEQLLADGVGFDRLHANVRDGLVHAVGVSCSSYARGQAVTFFQGQEGLQEWERARRRGVRTALTVKHLMASTALPFIFRARCLNNEYFGDGSLRLNAPLSPAIHLGADRLLVIGIRDSMVDTATEAESTEYPPSVGSLAGYLLDIAFSDNLETDIERLRRINNTLSLMTEEQRSQTDLKSIDILNIQPSVDIRELVPRYVAELPWNIRMLIRGASSNGEDMRLSSFLLFEPGFIRELIALGYEDAMARRDELREFLQREEPAH